jgi:hypothetical protein
MSTRSRYFCTCVPKNLDRIRAMIEFIEKTQPGRIGDEAAVGGIEGNVQRTCSESNWPFLATQANGYGNEVDFRADEEGAREFLEALLDFLAEDPVMDAAFGWAGCGSDRARKLLADLDGKQIVRPRWVDPRDREDPARVIIGLDRLVQGLLVPGEVAVLMWDQLEDDEDYPSSGTTILAPGREPEPAYDSRIVMLLESSFRAMEEEGPIR